MTSFFRQSGPSVNNPPVPAAGLRVQSSVQGRCIPLGWGRGRLAGNLIWYGDFTATAIANSGGGGKGGVGGGGGGKGSTGTTSYAYSTSFAMGLCEGPVSSINQAWNAKTIVTLASLNLTAFLGGYSQSAWGYLTSLHVGQARNYRGQAYVAAGPMQLGNTQEIPNLSFEVTFALNTAYSGVPDANPKDVVSDFLTNSHYGAGFPSARVGSLTTYSNYAIANDLVVSPVLTEQRAANAFLADLMLATNSEPVWSSGKLTVVPYGDQSVTANGATYTAPAAALYDLGEDDFLPLGEGEPPIRANRQRVADQTNAIKVEYLDRSNNYDPAVIEAKDDAAIQMYGLRAGNPHQLHMFGRAAPAVLCANLMLGRQQVRTTYTFKLPAKYILLDPMDIVSISDAGLGLDRQWVRITEIQEDNQHALTITAEEYLAGSGAAPAYGAQANSGAIPNYNVAPGAARTPLFFEPTAPLAGALEIWMGVCGSNPALWGGCDVWVSYDDVTYQFMGRQLGASRMGVLTSSLPSVTASGLGTTIDLSSTLAVDLSQSVGQLTAGSLADVLGLNTLCWVGSEFLAYRDVSVTGANAYHLTYLNRGAYGTSIGSHSSGTKFARIDDGIFRVPFTQDRIGSTIYVKLLSFNIWGGGQEQLPDVPAYSYQIVGTALSSPLSDVKNVVSLYQSNVSQISWDEIKDFRPVDYEIRKGTDWGSGQILGRFAHPPMTTQGDGTYFVSAHSQPVPGLHVYSTTPASIVLAGTVLPLNVAASYDEFASLPPSGSYGGTAYFDGSFIRTDGGDGTYEIPAGHQISVGRVAPCLVGISWTFAGQQASNNFFDYTDFFSQLDIFQAASAQLVDVYPEIALSQDGTTWGAWQKYNAGTYNAWKFKARVQLKYNANPLVQAYLTSFKFTVYAPTRIDHWAIISTVRTSLTNYALGTGGAALTFLPDSQTSAAQFNGGVSNATKPNVFVTILNPSAGDIVTVSSLTLSGCTIQVTNGGSGVARNISAIIEGY